MSRYFFDVIDDDGEHVDDIGVELPDLEAAKAEGRRALLEMSRETLSADAKGRLEMRIRDHIEGPIHISLKLEEVLETSDKSTRLT